VLGAVLSACGGRVATRGPAATPTLSDVLQTLAPQAQLDTLRALMPSHRDDAMLPFFAGNAYVALGQAHAADRTRAIAYFDSAVAAYRRAAELDSTYSRTYVNMGLAEDEAGRPGRARAAYGKAIAVNPKDVLAYCHLGSLEHAGGNMGEAVRLYETALRIDPASAQAHYNLGLAFAETRLFREALVEWEQVVKLDPDGELGASAGENVRIIRQYLGPGP
jgi:tetratricopeptide (TPR) repeat protein